MNKQMVAQTKKLLEQSKGQIKLALPAHMNADRIMRIAMTEVQKKPYLQKCDPLSIVGSVIEASQLGLDVGSEKGHAYLVPYGNKCQLIIGYKGYQELGRRSGDIKYFTARVVEEGDEFEIRYGTDESIHHVPSFGGGEMKLVYAVAHFKDGSKSFDVMTKKQVEDIKKRSKAASSGPWVTDFLQMARKTVVKRLCNYIPMSSDDLARAVGIDDQADLGAQNNAALVVNEDGTFRQETSAERLRKRMKQTEEIEVSSEPVEQEPTNFAEAPDA